MIPEILPVLTSLNKNPENTWIIKKQRRLSSADPVALCPSRTGHESMIVINILFNIFFVSLSIHPESIFCSNISAYFFFFFNIDKLFFINSILAKVQLPTWHHSIPSASFQMCLAMESSFSYNSFSKNLQHRTQISATEIPIYINSG